MEPIDEESLKVECGDLVNQSLTHQQVGALCYKLGVDTVGVVLIQLVWVKGSLTYKQCLQQFNLHVTGRSLGIVACMLTHSSDSSKY